MPKLLRHAMVVALCWLGAGAAWAQAEVSPTVPVAENNPTAARILWLDKQTNTRVHLTLNVGATQTFGALAVRLERCAMNLNNQPGTDAAWLVVSEPGRGTDWFAGWMINTAPEVATLDHPRYDVQLVGCGSQPRKKAGPVAKSGAAPVAGTDTEAAESGSADANADPFYVPGLETPTAVSPAPAATAPASEQNAKTVAEPVVAPAPPTPRPTPATPVLEDATPATEDSNLHQLMDGVY